MFTLTTVPENGKQRKQQLLETTGRFSSALQKGNNELGISLACRYKTAASRIICGMQLKGINCKVLKIFPLIPKRMM
jgi:hypothetical protein